MDRSARESPGLKPRTRKENYRKTATESIPLWKSTRQSKSVLTTGKRTNEWDFLTDRENDRQTDSVLEGLPLKKSNMASNSRSPEIQDGANEGPHNTPENDDDDEEEAEMTSAEKRALFKAVTDGDIDLVEDLLDKPFADINLTWYGENLLVAAIRADREEMAEFLIDNGIDYNYQLKVFELPEDKDSPPSVYHVSCRQKAYDQGLSNVVNLIDSKTGELFPFQKPRDRVVRVRKTNPGDGPPDLAADEASEVSVRGVSRKIKTRDKETIRDNDTDSGHHSDISRREDVTDSPDTSFEHSKDDFRQPDEGYCSVSPHSSRQGTPVTSADSGRRTAVIKSTKSALGIKRETLKTSQARQRDNANVLTSRKAVNVPGSYTRERPLWTPKSKSSKDELLCVSDEETVPALVRTQSPFQDDRPQNSRRHRRLPMTPNPIAQVHKPRIMSPPSQSGHRASKLLPHTKMAALPNKMTCPSLKNSPRATRIDLPGEAVVESSSKQVPRTQLKFGQTGTITDTANGNKYDDHFVNAKDMVKRKKSGNRS